MTCVLLCKSTRTLLKSVCMCVRLFSGPKLCAPANVTWDIIFMLFARQVKCV